MIVYVLTLFVLASTWDVQSQVSSLVDLLIWFALKPPGHAAHLYGLPIRLQEIFFYFLGP